ncbi:MAG: 3'-5' exonuclease [Treponema sp.]|nr:3'-5' exonuclease [Candidatus Treponema equifaecale]
MAQKNKLNLHLLNRYNDFYKLFQSGVNFCAFDTETTGLKPSTERLIEIGAVKFNKDGILGSMGTLINPGIPIPARATEINHITDQMVSDSPTEAEVIPQFLEFSKDTILVAHNAQFDLRFVNSVLERQEKPILPNKAIDTLIFSRWVLPDNEHWTQVFLAQQLGIEVRDAHRATDDARVCMELFIKLAEISKNYPKNWSRIIAKKRKQC